MKSFILSSLVLSLALVSTAAARDLTAAERAALAGQPATDVATLRAGAAEGLPAVKTAERPELSRANTSATDLDTLRAGDADNDHDLTVVGVVVGVVILAILIF